MKSKSSVVYFLLFVLGVYGLYLILPIRLHITSSSMMPLFLGPHWDLRCSHCNTPFILTIDDSSSDKVQLVRFAACPSCGFSENPVNTDLLLDGGSVSIQRTRFRKVEPTRWSLIAFKNPETDSFALKRVVGLPGESLKLIRGTLFVDNQPIPKPSSSWSSVPLDLQPEIQDQRILFKNVLAKSFMAGESSSHSPVVVPVTNQLPIASLEPISSERIDYVDDFLFHFDSSDFFQDNKLLVNQGDRFWLVEMNADKQFNFYRLDNPDPDSEKYFLTLNKESFPEPAGTFASNSLSERFTLSFRDFAVTVFREDGKPLFSIQNQPISLKNSPVTIPAAVLSENMSEIEKTKMSIYRDIGWSLPDKTVLTRDLGLDDYFLLGDNSASSIDSRYWSNPVKQKSLYKIVSYQ